MPGLRLLLRFAPFFAGALAAAVWLRRRQAARLALTAPAPPRTLPASPPSAARTGRFDRDQQAERGTIDIVTVVDDLLLAGR